MAQKAHNDKLTQAALKRIGEYETFLEACGITPMAGSEVEFHFTPQMSPNFKKLWAIKEFENSAFVERLEADTTVPKLGEIIIGKGPNSHSAERPRERYPSTIARVTRSAKKIIEDGGSKYGMDITFGEKENGKRIRSLQSNISLWRSDDKTPLFLNVGDAEGTRQVPNELTVECSKALIEAQRALAAVVCPSEASFKRYGTKDASYGIAVHDKRSDITALLRRNERSKDKPLSYYFEDRLASSDADPALAMLMTLGGIVTGVKQYMINNLLVDKDGKPAPEKMKAHIHAADFSKESWNSDKLTTATDMGTFATPPLDHEEALKQITKSYLAKEILGKEFYTDFCAHYEQVTRQAAQSR